MMAKRPASPFPLGTGKRFAREMLALDAWIKKEIGALRKQLERGPGRGQTLDQFAEWLFVQLEAVLDVRIRREREILFGLKRRRGRPKREVPKAPPKKRGAPQKLTPKLGQWFLNEIDSWKSRLAALGLDCSDSDALRVSIAASYFKNRETQPRTDEARRAEWVRAIDRIKKGASVASARPVPIKRAVFLRTCKLLENEHIAAGLVLGEARRLAKTKAQKLERSAVFRRRKEHLSRLRGRARMEA